MDALIIALAVAAVPLVVGAWNGIGILVNRHRMERRVRRIGDDA